MNKFGIILKKLRTEDNLTQNELANIFNVKNTTISAWEVGVNEPPLDILEGLVKYFNVSADYLLGLEDEYGNKLYDQPYNIKPKPIPTTLTANTAIPNTQTAIFMQHGGKPFTLELTQEDEAKILKLLDIKKKPL